MQLDQQQPELQQVLAHLVSQLDEDSQHLAFDPTVDFQHCLNFALSVYNEAYRRDAEGMVSLETANSYLDASVFIEVELMLNDVHGLSTLWCRLCNSSETCLPKLRVHGGWPFPEQKRSLNVLTPMENCRLMFLL